MPAEAKKKKAIAAGEVDPEGAGHQNEQGSLLRRSKELF